MINRRNLAIYESVIHAILNVGMSAYIYVKEGVHFDYSANNDLHYAFIGFSLGYYLIDTIFGFIYKYGSFANDLHNFIMISVFLYIIYKEIGANVFIFYMMVAEIPNPFMHIRKNLMMFNNVDFYFFLSGILFTITYIGCRVAWIGTNRYPIQIGAASCAEILLFTVWYLSLYWSFIVVEVFLKSLQNLSSSQLLRDLYTTVSCMKNSKISMAFLHATFTLLCYFRLVYYWSHREVF